MENKKYQVEITRVSDGKKVIQDMEFPDDEVVVSLFWMGNYGCDCNRGIFFGDRKVEDELPCSEGKYRVLVTREGEKVYEDEIEDEPPKVYENHGQDSRIKEVDIVPQLNAKAGTGGGNLPLVQEPVTYDMMQVTAPINKQNREPGDPCHTLAKGNAGNAAVVAFTQNQCGDILSGETCPSMGTNSNATGRNTPKINSGATVRRLTPTECERLRGFPDGYTKIPYRNKPADQCPDGPRYKALGNSWAVPCAAWIGKRIQEVDLKRTI